MDAFLKGLWAQGALTSKQKRRLLSFGDQPQSALEAWRDSERAWPSKWGADAPWHALVDWAGEGWLRLEKSLAASRGRWSIVSSDGWEGANGRSPYWMLAAVAPPMAGRLGIVGTRNLAGQHGSVEDWIEPWVRQAQAIISGGAKGVDAIAHHVALQQGIPTWYVSAGGFQHVGPAENLRMFENILENGGGWVSDKPPWYKPHPHDFLERNEVIATLSDALLVARAPARSGALSTARHALKKGRKVWVFPGNPDDPLAVGCHLMLAAGAEIGAVSTNISEVLGEASQGRLVFESDGEQASEAGHVDLDLDDQLIEKMRLFNDWLSEDAEGWIGDEAGHHQEVLLDLELAGVVTMDLCGTPTWTVRGRRLRKTAEASDLE